MATVRRLCVPAPPRYDDGRVSDTGSLGNAERSAVADSLLQATILAEAVEHAPFAFVVFDEFASPVACNLAAASILGLTRAELLARSVDELVVEGERMRRRFAAVVAGRRHKGTSTFVHADGSLVEVGYRIGETQVGGMRFLCAVLWPLG